MATLPTKLTARILERLQPGELIRDATVRGMFAERGKGAGAAVALKIQADLREGPRNGAARKPTSIRMTLGRFPDELTLDAARVEAMRLLAEIRAGRDPRPGRTAAPVSAWTVARMRDEYVKDLAIREKSARTASDMQYLFDQYLADWLPLLASAITKDAARDKHAKIAADNGKMSANKALKAFRTCFDFAKRVQSAPLGENPVDAVTFHKERPRKDRPEFVLPPVGGWLARVRSLKSPLRAVMHELGLFSGLRPGTLVALERAWVRLEDNAIVIPAGRMKGRKEFALPLSSHMVGLVRRALAAGDTLFPGAPFLFPTHSTEGAVIATQVWKERKLPAETGHIVRHLYSNVCNAAGVSSVHRQLLLGQKVPGIEGVYLSERALFASLLADQERVTAAMLAACGPAKVTEAA
jgi:integrase